MKNGEKLHRLVFETGKKPEAFTYPFCYTPHPWSVAAAEDLKKQIAQNKEWSEEIKKGKMLGVLVVEGGYLAAFSGTLCGKSDHEFFVPPVFDLHSPNCYFQKEERNISNINKEIEELQRQSELKEAENTWKVLCRQRDMEVQAMREAMSQAKVKRDEARQNGGNAEALIKESQFMKAELRRLNCRWKETIAEAERELHNLQQPIDDLRKERAARSAALQEWLFNQFSFLNAYGETATLKEIFHDMTPPAGAGECCAPKLLQYAYKHNLTPICMAEFWMGASPKDELRTEGNYYPACQAKCKPILGWMLQGLNVEPNPMTSEYEDICKQLRIIHENEDFLVIDKPSGMLSVPGKEELPSVKSKIERLYPQSTGPIIVHRLDMDTSGLMVVALNEQTYHELQEQFTRHTISKRYTAILEHPLPENAEGRIELPICANPNDRPRQMVDTTYGKRALTTYKAAGGNRVYLWPETGRTHQLRVHCAHPQGLNNPIKGDRLYGTANDRLQLYADTLEFEHKGTKYKFHL